jgi:hypothetical protein
MYRKDPKPQAPNVVPNGTKPPERNVRESKEQLKLLKGKFDGRPAPGAR